MSNHYFQFKQFRVEQEHCAMKVSTDACIHGAWTPIFKEVKQVLDIGTGTGLLSLMLAQRNAELIIDAIEIDPIAAQQAQTNFEASPWRERLSLIEGDARTFPVSKKYNLIICNPPFFKNSLLGNHKTRNEARHQLNLGFEEIFEVIEKHLDEGGYASVLLPFNEHQIWKRLLAEKGWNVFQELQIIPRENQSANRVVSICRSDRSFQEETIIIRNSASVYTQEFIQLLEPFYL